VTDWAGQGVRGGRLARIRVAVARRVWRGAIHGLDTGSEQISAFSPSAYSRANSKENLDLSAPETANVTHNRALGQPSIPWLGFDDSTSRAGDTLRGLLRGLPV
jgi:hypothetical protein